MIFSLRWGYIRKDCVEVCTDGDAAITEHIAGFHGRMRSASDLPIAFTHCMIHREALLAKKFSSNDVKSSVIKLIFHLSSLMKNF